MYDADGLLYTDPNKAKARHALTCIGWSCVSDNICYLIQDSYTWGKNPNNNIRIFYICCDINKLNLLSVANQQYVLAPFRLGIDFGNEWLSGITVELSPNQIEQIKQKFDECCPPPGCCCVDGEAKPNIKTVLDCGIAGGEWIEQPCNFVDCSEYISQLMFKGIP